MANTETKAQHGKYVIDIDQEYLELLFLQQGCNTAEEKQRLTDRIFTDICSFIDGGKTTKLFRTVFYNHTTRVLRRSFSITDFETGKELAVPMAVEDYADMMLAQWKKEKREQGETAPTRVFNIGSGDDHFVCELVYPENTNDFERELLEIITLGAASRIKHEIESGDKEQIEKIANILEKEWMTILGTYYRDYVTSVELSKYDCQGQSIYQVRFKSKFLYD